MNKLVDTIFEYTKSGHLQWKLKDSCFNSESTHNYECELRDGTKVEIEIHLDSSLNYNYNNYIIIRNKDLVDGRLFIHSNQHNKITSIGKIVYQMYIKPKIVPKAKTQSQAILDIISAIPTKEEVRDTKINQIINYSEQKKIKSEIKPQIKNEINPVENKAEKKSKLKRIFNILFNE